MLYQKEIDDSVLIQFIILYTLQHVDEPVRYKDLVNLVLENCNISFTDFQLALDNLIQTSHVNIFNEGPDVKKYEITQKGLQMDDFLRSMVPIYIREPIEESIKQMYIDKRRKEAVKANITPLRKNEYTADFELYDEDKIMLMTMSLYAGGRDEAERLAKYFKAHSGEIYEKIIEIFAPADKEFAD